MAWPLRNVGVAWIGADNFPILHKILRLLSAVPSLGQISGPGKKPQLDNYLLLASDVIWTNARSAPRLSEGLVLQISHQEDQDGRANMKNEGVCNAQRPSNLQQELN